MMVDDHPVEYGDFEGVIPEGRYGAGKVIIWDKGSFTLKGDSGKSFKKGHLVFELNGQKLKGSFDLVKIKGREENVWLLIKRKDEYASAKDITRDSKSVKSGLNIGQVGLAGRISKELLRKARRSKMPEGVRPMMAVLTDKPFDNPGWLFEIKWDGYRIIAEISKKIINLYSRDRLSYNDRFRPIIEALKKNFNHEAILDGEAVILDKTGRPSFPLMQNYQKTGEGDLVFYVFDILYLDGYDLRNLPLEKRKQILQNLVDETSAIKLSGYIKNRGTDFYKAAQNKNLEGIVAKNLKSIYRTGGRSTDWLEIKTQMRQEAVIAGFTKPRGERKYFGSLVLGVYEENKLKYIGHTGGGFDDKTLSDIYWKLNKLKTKRSPFREPPKMNTPVKWVRPRLVSEIKFSEWTKDGVMRRPVFLGLREDKNPKEVEIKKPVQAPAEVKTMS